MNLPLEGLTVLDLSRVLAGPYATQILGEVPLRNVGEPVRVYRLRVPEPVGVGA